MKVFVWDTETTGLYSKKEKDINKHPYIIQFAWILVEMKDNGKYEEVQRVDIKIKPPIKIPYETSKIHHIYDIDVANKEAFIAHADIIQHYLNTPDIVVWHNIEFDENMVRIEFERLKINFWVPYDYSPNKSVCTMNESTDYCKLHKKNSKSKWYKRPKLNELTKITLWTYFHWAHDAMVDVEWTLKAFSKLVEKKVIELKKNNTLTLF